MIKIENKLYSSTEVAEILGVSLRSVYRYLEEDKLKAEVKTATGRHRFTRQNIIDFLYPTGIPEGETVLEEAPRAEESHTPAPAVAPAAPSVPSTPVEPIVSPTPKVAPEVTPEPAPRIDVEEEKIEDDQVDWLAKFREAAKKFEDATEEVTGLGSSEEPIEEEAIVEDVEEEKMFYYRSRLGGLKDIAQNIDKTSRNSGLDYAFTLNAGLSLYRPINPFSVLHVYIRPKDKDFFERILALTPSEEKDAQLCIITSDEDEVFKGAEDLHGLKVVEKKRLIEDISELNEELLKEAESILK